MRFPDILALTQASLPGLSARFADELELGRKSYTALAPFESPVRVVSSLRRGELPQEERARIVFALIRARRTCGAELWNAVLVSAFAPMLSALRSRVRHVAGEDLDQIVLSGFIEAVEMGSISPFCPILSLRRATVKRIRAGITESRGFGKDEVAFADNVEEYERSEAAKHRAEDAANMVLRKLPSLLADEEVIRCLTATLGEGETLQEYVDRVFADRSDGERRATYLRLLKARTRALAILRQRLRVA